MITVEVLKKEMAGLMEALDRIRQLPPWVEPDRSWDSGLCNLEEECRRALPRRTLPRGASPGSGGVHCAVMDLRPPPGDPPPFVYGSDFVGRLRREDGGER